MPTIETERLRLRAFSLADADVYYAVILSDPDVMRYLPGGTPLPPDRTVPILHRITAHWSEHAFGLWAVEHLQDGALIGHCGLQYIPDTPDVELAYALAKSYWGTGLASEAAHASLRYGFETMGLDRIVAVAVAENAASLRVMAKIGMIYQGIQRAYNTELLCHALTRAEFDPGSAPYRLFSDQS